MRKPSVRNAAVAADIVRRLDELPERKLRAVHGVLTLITKANEEKKALESDIAALKSEKVALAAANETARATAHKLAETIDRKQNQIALLEKRVASQEGVRKIAVGDPGEDPDFGTRVAATLATPGSKR